jgi:hypothetical protein
MSPSEELKELYAQWRVLSEQEGVAIRRAGWLEVDQAQSSKNRLQARIVEVTQLIDPVPLELEFRSVVDGLIELERRNAAWIEAQRHETQAEVGACDRSARSLRQLQRLYIPPARQNWQSYS